MYICNPTLSPFKILHTFCAHQTKGLAVRCLSYYSSLTPVPWQCCSKSVIDDLSLIIATDFIIIFSCFAKMGLGLEELDTCHFLCPLLIAHLQQTKLLKHMNSRGKKSSKSRAADLVFHLHSYSRHKFSKKHWFSLLCLFPWSNNLLKSDF